MPRLKSPKFTGQCKCCGLEIAAWDDEVSVRDSLDNPIRKIPCVNCPACGAKVDVKPSKENLIIIAALAFATAAVLAALYKFGR